MIFSLGCRGMLFEDRDVEDNEKRVLEVPIVVQPGCNDCHSAKVAMAPQCGELCPASFWETGPVEVADASSPKPVRLLIPHIPQSSNWDCGLACTQMVLR